MLRIENGIMREYDKNIEHAIVNELFYSKDKENMGFRELKRNIEEKHLKRELSFETFGNHMKQMTMNNNSRYTVNRVLNRKYTTVEAKKVVTH